MVPPAVQTAFLIVSVILFILAAVPILAPQSSRLLAVGLAFFAAAHIS